MNRFDNESLIRKVEPRALRRYASRLGWIAVEGVPDFVSVYRRPENAFGELAIPMDRTLGDYAARIWDAVQVLARYAARSPESVLVEATLPPSDIIKMRALGPETETGTVPLGKGIELINGARKALLAAACAVADPQQYYAKLSRSSADEFINACLLGQSEHESYAVNIICPIDSVALDGAESDAQSPLFSFREVDTFARRSTKNLIASVNYIVESIENSREELLVSPNSDGMVISGNLCEALVEMQPIGSGASLEVYSTWSGELRNVPQTPSVVKISKECFGVIAIVGARLKPEFKPKRATFAGKLELVKITAKEEDDPHGEAVVAIREGDDLLHVKVLLKSPAEYHLACDALSRRAKVTFNGVLHRKDRHSWIEHQTTIQLLEDNKLF